MFTISRRSWDVLLEAEVRKLEDSLSEHVARFFPGRSAAMTPEDLRLAIRAALGRARDVGLTGRRDCFDYVTLCARYGWDFDERPANAWVRRMLRDRAVTDPSARLRRLVGTLQRQRERG